MAKTRICMAVVEAVSAVGDELEWRCSCRKCYRKERSSASMAAANDADLICCRRDGRGRTWPVMRYRLRWSRQRQCLFAVDEIGWRRWQRRLLLLLLASNGEDNGGWWVKSSFCYYSQNNKVFYFIFLFIFLNCFQGIRLWYELIWDGWEIRVCGGDLVELRKNNEIGD